MCIDSIHIAIAVNPNTRKINSSKSNDHAIITATNAIPTIVKNTAVKNLRIIASIISL
jgi:hypothetical protein